MKNIDMSKGIDEICKCLYALDRKEIDSAIFECNRSAFQQLRAMGASKPVNMFDREDEYFTFLGVPVVVTGFDGLRLVT